MIAICEKEPACRDGRFCSGFLDASGSICRNLAEGFARFESVYIVQFFGYALSSLTEVQDYLEESRLRRFISQPEFDKLWDLSEHAKAKALKFERPHRERLGKRRRRPRSER